MKIAVTGATGFIGSHIVEALVGRGHEVTCLARSPERTREISGLPVRFVFGSLDSSRALTDLVDDQDAVVHAAGLTKAPSLEEYIRVNVGGTEKLVSAIRGNGAHLRRLVFFSSAEAMGPSPRGLPLTEDVIPQPFSAYGKSKILAESCLDSLKDRLPVTIIRPPTVYGPRDRDLAILFRLVARGLLPVVIPSPAYSVLYVKNLAEAICLTVERPQDGVCRYFFTDGPVVSWFEFGGMIARALNRRPLTLRVPQLALRAVAFAAGIFNAITGKAGILSQDKIRELAGSWVVSDERARRELGYRPSFSTEQGVAETVGWYRNRGWL